MRAGEVVSDRAWPPPRGTRERCLYFECWPYYDSVGHNCDQDITDEDGEVIG